MENKKQDNRPKLNAAWHLSHPMPKKASLEERIEWHIAHVKNCACRGIPGKLLEEMKKRKIVIPVEAGEPD